MTTFTYKLLVILAVTLTFLGCSKPQEVQKISGDAQGTTYHISFWSPQAIDKASIQQAVEAEFNRLDTQLSNYRKDSVIEQLNATVSSEPIAVSEEIVGLIEQARAVSVASGGCYDLTIKPLFDLWGFNGDKLTPPDAATLQAALKQVGFNQIKIVDANHIQKLNPQLKIDLSSIAQGYSVSRMVSVLEQQGIENYLVEIGGELQTRGQKPDASPWRIALEKPLSSERTMQKVVTINRIEPLAIMTSGTYRHYFDVDGKRYSHILDANTGIPVDHNTVSVTVLHDNPTQADAWSTALLCLGKTKGLEVANQAGIAVLFIEQQGEAFNEYRSAPFDALKQISIE
ncbi:MAG: thiamine biosynthesis lipoprotein [Methylococcaceae bacterium NSP1-2]|nr:FAD:protein FMN transferase [Methylococcaceae bacterium]OYV17299.1 MAG: thiamine biosynthesis lipoprotein [Methylococcaceae bacterium NSP1-2]